jgi:hypothetical protein
VDCAELREAAANATRIAKPMISRRRNVLFIFSLSCEKLETAPLSCGL